MNSDTPTALLTVRNMLEKHFIIPEALYYFLIVTTVYIPLRTDWAKGLWSPHLTLTITLATIWLTGLVTYVKSPQVQLLVGPAWVWSLFIWSTMNGATLVIGYLTVVDAQAPSLMGPIALMATLLVIAVERTLYLLTRRMVLP